MRLIVTTMKDEGPFMLEWVAYHLSIGFDHFIINTNDCSDGTDEIAIRLEQLGLATHIDNPGPWEKGPQASAYDNAMAHPKLQDAEWILVSDADEFLNIHVGDGTLDALFAEVPDANLISFNWLLFGHNGIVEFEDRFVTEQFTRSAHPLRRWPVVCLAFKTLHRRDAPFQSISTHRPKAPHRDWQKHVRWVDGDGDDISRAFAHFGWHSNRVGVGLGNRLGRMHHYATRSLNSYLMKRLRGDVRSTAYHRKLEETGVAYWKIHCWNSIENDNMRRHRGRLSDRYDALLADPVLAELHASAVDHHKQRIEQLAQSELGKEFTAAFKDYVGGFEWASDHYAVTCPDLSLDEPHFDVETYADMLKAARQASVRTARLHGRLPWFANADALGVDFSKGRVAMENPPARLLPVDPEFVASSRKSPAPAPPARRKRRTRFLRHLGRRGKRWAVVNTGDPELIEDVLSTIDPSTLVVIHSWGYDPLLHTIERSRRSPKARLVSQDADFVDFIHRFGSEIKAGKLKVERCDPHYALKAYSKGSFDGVFLSGGLRPNRLSKTFASVMESVADDGIFMIDGYHRRGPHGDASLQTLHRLLSSKSSEVRIDSLDGPLCAVQKLPPLSCSDEGVPALETEES